jgi:hypothetical protein
VGDFSGREAADRSQHQDHLCLARKRQMAAGEHQPEAVVRLLRHWVFQLSEFVAVACVASELVDGSTTSYRQQPGAGLSRNTFDRPTFQRDQQGILDNLLSSTTGQISTTL